MNVLQRTRFLPRLSLLNTRSYYPWNEGFYNEEQKAMQKSLKKLIDTEINPHVDLWEEKGLFPAHEVFKKVGSGGFLGVNKPTECGGLGLDYKTHFAIVEAFGHIKCGGVPMGILVQTDAATPALAKFGSDKLKAEFLTPSISGDVVSAIGVSEPGAGSDVANIKTRAEKKGDDLVINGEKLWITNGAQADWICLLANTSQGPLHKNKSLICVPMKTKGVRVARTLDKFGMRSSDTAHIFFDDVRVPASHIIGEEGLGFIYQMIQFQEERLCGAGLVLLPFEQLLETTIDYCRQRKTFGKSLIDNQYIHFELAELATELECYRALTYKAVDAMMLGEDVTLFASMAKLKAGRLGRILPDKCLQFWGGMGYTNEVPIARYLRDLRLISIGGGTDEMMLGIISKYMGILPQITKKEKDQAKQ